MNRIQKAAMDRDKIRKQAPALADLIHNMMVAKKQGKDPYNCAPPHRRQSEISSPPRIRTKSKSQPENKVVQACLRWLKDRNIFAWRNNTGTAWIGDRPIRYGLVGSADILGLLPDGRFLAVECKSEKGRQSDTQKTFEENITTNKGVYVLAYSAADLEERLNGEDYSVNQG